MNDHRKGYPSPLWNSEIIVKAIKVPERKPGHVSGLTLPRAGDGQRKPLVLDIDE